VEIGTVSTCFFLSVVTGRVAVPSWVTLAAAFLSLFQVPEVREQSLGMQLVHPAAPVHPQSSL